MSNVIEEIELDIKEANKMVDLGKALDRLTNNRDFKKIIIDGYLRDEAVRLVHLKGAPGMQPADKQEAIVKELDGIGALLGYFRKIEYQTQMAQSAINDSEAALEELRAEEYTNEGADI